VPTTFQGMSSESETMTSVADDFQPCAGMASARTMPSGNSTSRTASENVIWRNSAPCNSSSRMIAANHSVPTKTFCVGEMMSCTE